MKVVWIFSTTHRFTFAYFTEYLLYNERNAGMAIACQIEKYGFIWDELIKCLSLHTHTMLRQTQIRSHS